MLIIRQMKARSGTSAYSVRASKLYTDSRDGTVLIWADTYGWSVSRGHAVPWKRDGSRLLRGPDEYDLELEKIEAEIAGLRKRYQSLLDEAAIRGRAVSLDDVRQFAAL